MKWQRVLPLLALRAPIHNRTLAHVTQIQCVAVACEHLATESRVVGAFEAGVGSEKLFRFPAGLFQDWLVVAEVGDS